MRRVRYRKAGRSGGIASQLEDRRREILIDGGSSGSGGYFRFLHALLAPGRVPDDLHVTLLCSPSIAKEVQPIDESVRLVEEPRLAATSRVNRIHWWLTEYPKLVRSVSPDLILFPTGIRRGYSRGVASVAVHHNMVPFMGSGEGRKLGSRQSVSPLALRVRLTRSLRGATGVLFQSAYAQREVVRQVGSLPRSAVVPNGIDGGFEPAPLKSYAFGDDVTILYVSPIYLYKHQWNVVAAVSTLRQELTMDLRLRLVGPAEAEALALLEASIQAHDAATFTSIEMEIPATDMPGLYQSADLFVFASSAETWPITLLEAMASALPIASSDRMAMPDLLQDGAVYFNPEDPLSIAAALRMLLIDEDLRLSIAGRACRRAKNFRWEDSVALLYEFVRSCV